jgi:hypothetical protein
MLQPPRRTGKTPVEHVLCASAKESCSTRPSGGPGRCGPRTSTSDWYLSTSSPYMMMRIRCRLAPSEGSSFTKCSALARTAQASTARRTAMQPSSVRTRSARFRSSSQRRARLSDADPSQLPALNKSTHQDVKVCLLQHESMALNVSPKRGGTLSAAIRLLASSARKSSKHVSSESDEMPHIARL